MIYAKLAGILALALALAGGGFHFGRLSGDLKAADARTSLETDHAAMAKAATDALLAQRAASDAAAVRNHATEAQHAKTIIQIDAAPPIRTPVFLCAPGDPLRAGAVSSAENQAGGIPADPAEGRSQSADRGRDIRPAIEALKRQLEKVMADYRQLDAEWPG